MAQSLERIVIANNSNYCVSSSLSELSQLLRCNTADVLGLTESFEFANHLQSYFFVLNKTCFANAGFWDWWTSVNNFDEKNTVVHQCEIPMKHAMEKAGLQVDIVFSMAKLRAFALSNEGANFFQAFAHAPPYQHAYAELVNSTYQINPTYFLWLLLNRLGFPFIKKILVRERYAGFQDQVRLNNLHGVDRARQHLQLCSTCDRPKVAICIFSFGSIEGVLRCVRSIENHVLYPSITIVVVKDHSAEQPIVDQLEWCKLNSRLPIDVFDMRNSSNSESKYKMLESVRADYFLIQNDSVIARDDYVSRLMQLATVEKVGLCGLRFDDTTGKVDGDSNAPAFDNGNETKVEDDCSVFVVRSSLLWLLSGPDDIVLDWNTLSRRILVSGRTIVRCRHG